MTTPLPTDTFNVSKLYNIPSNVSAEIVDSIRGYFLGITNSRQIAENYTSLVFKIASQLQKPVSEIVDLFKKQNNELVMTNTIAYYLNQLSSTRTVLFGTSDPLPPNPRVVRNVIQ